MRLLLATIKLMSLGPVKFPGKEQEKMQLLNCFPSLTSVRVTHSVSYQLNSWTLRMLCVL